MAGEPARGLAGRFADFAAGRRVVEDFRAGAVVRVITVFATTGYRRRDVLTHAAFIYDNLGLRDWLAEPATWLLVEWPERSAGLRALADVEIVLEIAGPASRRVRAAAKTARGREAVGLLAGD